MKPIATLMKPLRSVDLTTMAESPAAIERSDVCAVPAAAVVAEAMVAFVLADALLEKFGGDSIDELRANWQAIQSPHGGHGSAPKPNTTIKQQSTQSPQSEESATLESPNAPSSCSETRQTSRCAPDIAWSNASCRIR